MSGRAGEPDKVHFRAERFEFSNGQWFYLTREGDRKSTRLNSSHSQQSRMPSSA